MPRIKIHMPEKSLAVVKIPVRITDLNYGNHVGNSNLVEIIHEARVQFLKLHSFTEMDAGGTSLIMNELQVVYKNESFYNDVLEVALFCGGISAAGFELFYQITANRNNGLLVIANAKTGMVCYNYQKKKVGLLPDTLRSILAT